VIAKAPVFRCSRREELFPNNAARTSELEFRPKDSAIPLGQAPKQQAQEYSELSAPPAWVFLERNFTRPPAAAAIQCGPTRWRPPRDCMCATISVRSHVQIPFTGSHDYQQQRDRDDLVTSAFAFNKEIHGASWPLGRESINRAKRPSVPLVTSVLPRINPTRHSYGASPFLANCTPAVPAPPTAAPQAARHTRSPLANFSFNTADRRLV